MARYTKQERQEIVKAVESVMGRYRVKPKRDALFNNAYNALSDDLQSKLSYNEKPWDWSRDGVARIYKEEKSKKDYQIFEKAFDNVFVRVRHFSAIPNAGATLDALMPILCSKYIDLIREGVLRDFRTPKMRSHFLPLLQNEEMKAMFSRSGLDHLWDIELPKHMSEQQRDIYGIDYNGGMHKGKQKPVIVPPSKIGDRLGAGGLRDLANQASQTPSGAGGHSPKQKAEFRKPKPATRKP